MAGSNPGATYNGKAWPALDPDQQRLLYNALTSNRLKQSVSSAGPKSSQESAVQTQSNAVAKNGSGAIDPSVFNKTPQSSSSDAPLPKPSSVKEDGFPVGLNDSGLDFDLGLENDNTAPAEDYFGFDAAEFEGESGEKRKNPDDDDDLEEIDGGEFKRRESGDNPAKKPGRKPLTSEPTTKRKAQNRAAQRAFRERKEKHVKDLEVKVMDLEKASESANHENGVLRAQVDRLQDELKDYRRRLSGNSNPLASRGNSLDSAFGTGLADFNFDFTKFGPAGASQPALASSQAQRSDITGGRQTQSPSSFTTSSSNGSSTLRDRTMNSLNSRSASLNQDHTPINKNGSARQTSNGMFGNGFFEGMTNSNHFGSNTQFPIDFSSADSNGAPQAYSSPAGSGSGASASSSHSNKGPSSSCCTSPDPVDAWLNYEENSKGQQSGDSKSAAGSTPGLSSGKTPNSEIASLDWLASQNGGQFDPVLFGDYRDNQEAIVGTDLFSSGFFEDSLPLPDMNNPFNFNLSTDRTIPARVAETPKPSLMEQVDRQRDGGVEPQAREAPSLMTCHKIWNQLQDCPNFKSGDFDVDSLCAELSSKAKCTETGLAIPKDAVEAALWKLSGPEGSIGSSH